MSAVGATGSTSQDPRSAEPNILVRLHGRNEVPCVRMWGWTNTIVLGFPTLKDDLVMRKVTKQEDGSLPAKMEDYRQMSQSLRALANMADSYYQLLLAPVCVQVIAKKKVDMIAMAEEPVKRTNNIQQQSRSNNQIESNKYELCSALIIGNLVVADNTGACAVTLFSEATEIIHSEIEIGDCLLITRASYHAPPPFSSIGGNPFLKDLLAVEIKLDKYQVRHIAHIPYRLHSEFKLLELNLFDPDDRLWFPSDLLHDPNGFDAFKIKPATGTQTHTQTYAEKLKLKQKYFDVLGFISFVGMLERSEILERKCICYEENLGESGMLEPDLSKRYDAPVKQFLAFRWIELSDKSSCQPLLVKILLSKHNMALQERLVPGTLVVLTHCQTSTLNFTSPFITTTIFTTIYLNEDVKVYFKLMPQKYIKSAENHISADAARMLFQRRDLKWCAGGTGRPTIQSSDGFINHFLALELKDPLKFLRRGIGIKLKLSRRESLMHYFRGKIVAVQKITESEKSHGRQANQSNRKFAFGSAATIEQNQDNWTLVKNSYSANNWLCHRRKLRPFTFPALDGTETTRQLVEAVNAVTDKYCPPLLFPSGDQLVPVNEPLRACQILRNPPYFRVIIKDEDSRRFYDTTWRTFPEEEMKSKWEAAKGKVIIGIIDIHCIEKEWGLEVALRDFVIESLTGMDVIESVPSTNLSGQPVPGTSRSG